MSTGARDSAANSDSGAARPVTAATRTRTLGSLHEFRPDSEEFSTYIHGEGRKYFAANDVPEDKKVPVFLNAIGGSTYGVLRSLLAPDSPMTKTLAQITTKLREHFEPTPSVIAERFQFHKRNQNSAESIAD